MNEIRSNKTSTNMGAVTKEEVEKFARAALNAEEYFDWKMEWTDNAPSICLRNKSEDEPGGRILIKDKIIGRYPWEAYHEVLHEISHIGAFPGHGMAFHDEYARLIRRHLGTEKRGEGEPDPNVKFPESEPIDKM